MLSKTQIVRFVLREEKVEVGPLWGETNLPSLVMDLLLGQTSKNFQFFQSLWLFWSILWLLDLAEWTWYDWLLHVSYYKCPISANCPSTVFDYKCKEWLIKNKAADAPVTFEEIVTVMIKTTRRTTNDKMLVSFGHIHFLYFEELNNSIIFMTTFSNICQSG